MLWQFFLALFVSHCYSFQLRRCILQSWNSREEIGSCIVEKHDKAYHIRLDDHHPIVVPRLAVEEDIASALWASSIAGSILLKQQKQLDIRNKSVLEVGCGLGLLGLSLENDNVVFTDMNTEVLDSLKKLGKKTQSLDYRDTPHYERCQDDLDVVIGADVAYYHYLLRPLMDTIRYNLFGTVDITQKGADEKLAIIVGQANRQSQWDLFYNIRDGCYNVKTDARDGPWPGQTDMLLYKLEMSEWVDGAAFAGESDLRRSGVTSISVIVHSNVGATPALSPFDYIATKEDDEDIMKSF